ncbi:uncharacterized protein [Physcomitrium patens]|uniref:uncharacterized protein n=1 Tax=Physcomitrium patens TaxID=3218 RepID=UPI003CCC9489
MSTIPPIVDNGAQYYNVMSMATRAPVPLLALPEPQLERRVEDLEKKIQAGQEGFQDSVMKQIKALTEQMAFMIKNQNSNTPPPRIESGNHNSGVWCTTCGQNGHSSLQCRVRRQGNLNPQPYQPTHGYGRDRGPQQRQGGYQGGPQGYGRSGKPRKEYHELCRRWHEPDQCWDDGQSWPCGNCGGNHPTHECRQPDKVIQLPPPITNPYENARNNMRDQRRPHGDDQRGLRPPNLYYNYEDSRQNHQHPEGLQTRQGYIPVAQNQQGGYRNYANQKQGPSSNQDVRVAEEVLLNGRAPSLVKTTVVIEEHEAPSNLMTQELKKDGGGGQENATLGVITRGQAHRQSPIDEEDSDSSEFEELLDLVALEAAAKEAARITKEVGTAVGDERSSEGSDPGKGLELGEWKGPDIPEEEFGGLGCTMPTFYQKYDLWRDLRRIKADISIAQLLEISPLMRKSFKEGLPRAKRKKKTQKRTVARVQASIRLVDMKAVEIEVTIVDKVVLNVLIDGSSGLNIMPLHTMEKLGLNLTRPSSFVLNMADQSPARPLGQITNCKISIGGEDYLVTFHVIRMHTSKESFPLLLGRP